MSQHARQDYEIQNQLGLHARAAAALVALTARFQSEITLSAKGVHADGKSILGILTLAAARGTLLTVECKGPDAPEALEAIGALIQSRFGES